MYITVRHETEVEHIFITTEMLDNFGCMLSVRAETLTELPFVIVISVGSSAILSPLLDARHAFLVTEGKLNNDELRDAEEGRAFL